MCVCVSFARECVVYIVKEDASFRGLGQLMGVAHKITRIRQQEECKTATNTNNCCI